MNVCVDGRLLDFEKNTGISRYSEFIIEYYLKRGYRVSVIFNNENNLIAGCNPIYTRLKPYNLWDFYKYSDFIQKIPFDILHIPFYSGLNKRLDYSKGKVIVTVHDLMYLLVDNFFGNNKVLNFFKKAYFNKIVKRSIDNANLVISVSNTTKEDILREFNTPSVVIPEHSEISSLEDNSILSTYSLVPKQYFFYCGNNRPHKNIDFIRKWFENSTINMPLVLAGSGHTSSYSSNIITTGTLSNGCLKSLYMNAQAFIFPSSYEGFGLPVLESLYCETPIICSDISAFREFNNPNIFYYTLNDPDSFVNAIHKVQESEYTPDKDFFQNYSVEHIYSILDRHIKTLINS